MKKITYFLFCMISSAIWSQNGDFNATSTSVVMVKPTAHIYMNADLKIASTASFTVESNATHSGSLIAPNSDEATGLFKYLRYLPTTKHVISAPVVGQQINTFNTTNDIASQGSELLIGQYVSNRARGTNKWFFDYKSTTTDPLTPGKGYALVMKNAVPITFEGSLKSAGTGLSYTMPEFFSPGEAFVAQTGFEDGQWGTHVWTAMGNPYPSYLDGLGLLTDNAASMNPLRAYLYVYDSDDIDSNPATNYIILNNASTYASKGISPGQAFLVDPSGYNKTFVMNESRQRPQATGDLFSRSAAVPEITLNITNASSSSKNTNVKKSFTLFKFFNNTTRGLDVTWDAGSDSNGSFAVHSRLADGYEAFNFALQCLPNYDYEQNTIPLAVYSAANEPLNFSADILNFPAGVSVYLEDKLENKITNLSETNYVVTPAIAQSGIGRFYLYTSSSVLSVENTASETPFSLFKRTNNNVMVVGLELQSKADFVMYDVAGKQVFSTDFVVKALKEDVTIPNLASGVYIVNVISDQKNISKKLVIE